jgi:hypothetical protein
LAAEIWGIREQTKYLWLIFIRPMTSIRENGAGNPKCRKEKGKFPSAVELLTKF